MEERGGKEALKEARRRFTRENTCLSAGSDLLTTHSASSLKDCRIRGFFSMNQKPFMRTFNILWRRKEMVSPHPLTLTLQET
jgi:hypothetical protein